MIERIRWNTTKRLGDLPSAFMRGSGERPLQITFHSDTLAKLSGKSLEALNLLQELRHVPEIEAVGTDPQFLPCMEVGCLDANSECVPVSLRRGGKNTTSTGVWNPRQWPQIAAHTVGHSSEHPEARLMLDHLLVARAHREIGGDIFVTESALLLKHRQKNWISDTNPRTVLEAAQIVGLFLRSRDNYVYRAAPSYSAIFDRGLFYWVLTRFRLPAMWQYFGVCVTAGQMRGDDTLELGQSVLRRAVRALEARDAVGIQFYSPQDNNSRDEMMYHFDYLTLLLGGAIDAQARIANRAYKAVRNDRFVSLRGKQGESLLNALKKTSAHRLCELLESQRFKDVLELVHAPRNTIHGAALDSLAYVHRVEPEVSYVTLPDSIGQTVWTCAQRLGGTDVWGLQRPHKETWLEPYSYASTLVRNVFDIINELATVTEVSLLFPPGFPIPTLTDEPQSTEPFVWGERLALLG